MALWWLCSPESMPSICLVYGLAVAAGGFEMNWPQQPKWNQPRKGARDAARQSRSRSQNSLNAETQRFAARPSRNRTARSVWSAWSLLPLSNRPTPYDSASKLDALQTLRVAVHPQKPSQPAKNLDYCSAEGRREGRKKRLFSSAFLRA